MVFDVSYYTENKIFTNKFIIDNVRNQHSNICSYILDNRGQQSYNRFKGSFSDKTIFRNKHVSNFLGSVTSNANLKSNLISFKNVYFSNTRYDYIVIYLFDNFQGY